MTFKIWFGSLFQYLLFGVASCVRQRKKKKRKKKERMWVYHVAVGVHLSKVSENGREKRDSLIPFDLGRF